MADRSNERVCILHKRAGCLAGWMVLGELPRRRLRSSIFPLLMVHFTTHRVVPGGRTSIFLHFFHFAFSSSFLVVVVVPTKGDEKRFVARRPFRYRSSPFFFFSSIAFSCVRRFQQQFRTTPSFDAVVVTRYQHHRRNR